MNSYTVFATKLPSGNILKGEVFGHRTPEQAAGAFCMQEGLKPEEIGDIVVTLGGCGSTMLHRSANVNRSHSEPTQEELQAAFNLVAPKGHWKNPIDALIKHPGDKMLETIISAISHFTGSCAEVFPAKAGKIRIVASGYYAAIGA